MTSPSPLKLRDTTAFRLSMSYAVIFCLLALIASYLVYQHVLEAANQQINAGLAAEAYTLASAGRHATSAEMTRIIESRSSRHSLVQSNHNDSGPRFYLMVAPDGHFIAGSMPHWQEVLAKQGQRTLHDIRINTPPNIKALVEGRDQFTLRARQAILPDGTRVLVAQSLNEQAELHHEIIRLAEILILLMVSVGLLGGWLIGRTVVRSLHHVIMAASQIMKGDLSRRITPSRQTDEFALLAKHLNLMLARIEALMQNLHDVTENMAHDLRTPLARLRANAELALAEVNEPRARQALATSITESESLVRLIEGIMSIAQVEAGDRESWGKVDLISLCRGIVEFYEPLAEDKQLQFDTNYPNQTVRLNGNPQLLSQAIGNLIDNAIKYTPENGRLRLELTTKSGDAILTLTDTGLGIPAASREKALKRFVRLDSSRSLPGNGLGLAMVDAIVKQHNGQLQLSDATPHGLKVSLILPL